MPEKRLFLLGAGGHGAVVLDALRVSGVCVEAIIDPAWSPGSTIFDVSVLGGDECLEECSPDEIFLANGVGATPGGNLRSQLFARWKRRGFEFVSILHPAAVVGRSVRLAEGSQVMAGVVLQCRSEVGENAVINTRASVDHDCRLGAHVFVGPGATLCGEVSVGDEAFVGAGAVIMPGITVGAGAIVGAGAVVTSDVPCRVLVAGNPATYKKDVLA